MRPPLYLMIHRTEQNSHIHQKETNINIEALEIAK